MIEHPEFPEGDWSFEGTRFFLVGTKIRSSRDSCNYPTSYEDEEIVVSAPTFEDLQEVAAQTEILLRTKYDALLDLVFLEEGTLAESTYGSASSKLFDEPAAPKIEWTGLFYGQYDASERPNFGKNSHAWRVYTSGRELNKSVLTFKKEQTKLENERRRQAAAEARDLTEFERLKTKFEK